MSDRKTPITPVMLEVIQRYLKAGDFTNIEPKEETNDTEDNNN
jgi:hypothetical protein